MTERPTNAADPAQVKERQRKAREIEQQQRDDLLALLAQPEFRRYAWRHMNETCGMLKSSASSNGSLQSLNIGMQDVGRALWAEIEAADPLAIPKMMAEYFEARKQS